MNKTVKVIFTLLVAVMVVATFSQTCLAASDAIENFDTNQWQSTDISGVQSIAQKVLTAIRNIAIIVAVIMISILGIQYMVGSAEQKASYKKAFIPLIVGAILVVSAAQIAKMLFSLSA